MDICEVASTGKAAMHMLTIRVGSMHAHSAARLPVVRRLGLHLEGASGRSGRCSSFWARNPSEREIAAEAALGVHPVRPASEHADLTASIPIVRDIGVGGKLATACRAWDGKKITTATKTTLQMLTITITSEVTHLARWVPEVAHADREIDELALSSLCAFPGAGNSHQQEHSNRAMHCP